MERTQPGEQCQQSANRIVIPVDPVPKPRMTRSDRWKQRACVLRYRVYCDCLRASGAQLSKRMRMVFNMPMPANWSGKRRESLRGSYHGKRPDIDNLIKAVLDALSDHEDSHVSEIVAVKLWQDQGSVEIEQLRDS
ncbi:MAG: RusA family crossover junction endodeoxyribonuclease [bacterium]|nr:RusA family crossover junction endodeoxyribonuclease [bacterium]